MIQSWLRIAAVALVVSPLLAQAQDNAAYQAAYDRGQAAFTQNDYAGCAEEFRQAFNIEPRGNLLYNIAFCYEKAGDPANAVAFYQRFNEAVPNSPKRPAVQRHISELQEQVQDQFEEVSVTSEPSGAMVFVDDKSRGAMGATPLTFKLLPGSYTLIGESPGHEPARRKLDLKKGASAQVELSLVSTDQVGTINLMVTERDADVLVDNRKVGKTPLSEPLRLKQGTHELLVTKSGFGSFSRSVDVQAGKTETIKADLASGAAAGEGGGESSSGGGGDAPLFTGPRLLPTITMGVGLGAVLGGVVAGLSAKKLHDQLDDKKKKGEPIAAQDVDTGNSRVLMTNVLFGGGGAAVIGGGVWWFLSGKGASATPDIGVSMAPDGSAQVWGTF